MRKGFLIYVEMCEYFPLFEEAVSLVWLCNCSTLNFLIYEENLIFFFISAFHQNAYRLWYKENWIEPTWTMSGSRGCGMLTENIWQSYFSTSLANDLIIKSVIWLTTLSLTNLGHFLNWKVRNKYKRMSIVNGLLKARNAYLLALGCTAHFRLRSKREKCERKPFRLEPKIIWSETGAP